MLRLATKREAGRLGRLGRVTRQPGEDVTNTSKSARADKKGQSDLAKKKLLRRSFVHKQDSLGLNAIYSCVLLRRKIVNTLVRFSDWNV